MNLCQSFVPLRRLAWPLGLLVSSAVAGVLADEAGQPAAAVSGSTDRPLGGPSAAPSRRKDDEKAGERLREGTRLSDVSGSFQSTGERVSFHPDGKGESYRVLENLALERIDRVLGEARGTPSWTISGVVTEFRGSNYLLVTKAIVRAAGDAPASGP